MAQLHAAMSVIEAVSTAMADLSRHVTENRSRKGGDGAGDSDAMSAAKKSSATKERQRRAQQANTAAEMVEDANADHLQATVLLELELGTSMTDLMAITASQGTLLGFARSRMTRGLTAAEYARYAALSFALIRDVNDFMRRVTQMELDAVRLRHHDALLHSDQRPTAASQTGSMAAGAAGDGDGSVYGGGEKTDDHSLLFSGSGLLPPLTPYQTPPVSGPSSRAASPPLSVDGDDGDIGDLMDD